jgi:hypothetical protein
MLEPRRLTTLYASTACYKDIYIDAVSSSDYIASSYSIISERWIEKDMEVRGRGLTVSFMVLKKKIRNQDSRFAGQESNRPNRSQDLTCPIISWRVMPIDDTTGAEVVVTSAVAGPDAAWITVRTGTLPWDVSHLGKSRNMSYRISDWV